MFELQINEHEPYLDHSFVPHDKTVDRTQRFETSLENTLRVTDLHGRSMHRLAFLISFYEDSKMRPLQYLGFRELLNKLMIEVDFETNLDSLFDS